MPTVFLSALGGAGQQWFDNNGDPLNGGLLEVYEAGTSTPLPTYNSISGTNLNTNPIELDASGRLAGNAEIWVETGKVAKFLLFDSLGNLIQTQDNIPLINDVSSDSDTILALLANTTDVTKGDALIGFRQSDSSGALVGATGRTVHQKLQEVISVLDFGADPTGVADSTASIQQALNTLSTKGGILKVPNGIYRLYSNSSIAALTIPANVQVIGDGLNSETKGTVFKYYGSGTAVTLGDNTGVGGDWNSSLIDVSILNLGSGELALRVDKDNCQARVTISKMTGYSGFLVGMNVLNNRNFSLLEGSKIKYSILKNLNLSNVNFATINSFFVTSPIHIYIETSSGQIDISEKCQFSDDSILAAPTTLSSVKTANNIAITKLTIGGTFNNILNSLLQEILINANVSRLNIINCNFSGTTGLSVPPTSPVHVDYSVVSLIVSSNRAKIKDSTTPPFSGYTSVIRYTNLSPLYQASSENSYSTESIYSPATFTPTVTAATPPTGVTYSSQLGFIIRNPSTVIVSGYIALTSKGSGGSGDVIINLPVACKTVTPSGTYSFFGACSVGEFSAAGYTGNLSCTVLEGTSQLKITIVGSSATYPIAPLQYVGLLNTSKLQFQIEYPI